MSSPVDAATVARQTSASPEQVWSVLADGWVYPTWVVGACRVRAVEPDWPQVGQRIHHSFGTWPVLTTSVVDQHGHDRHHPQTGGTLDLGSSWP